MRRVLRQAIWILTGVVCVIGWVGPAAAQEEPVVSVSPETDLQDGDIVLVTGVGFEPESTVFVLLCSSDTELGDLTERCSLIGEAATGYLVAEDGTFTAPDIAIPVGQIGSNPSSTCPPSAEQATAGAGCSIEVAGEDLVPLATSPVDVTAPVDGTQGPGGSLAHTGASLELVVVGVSLVVLGCMIAGLGRSLRPESA